MCAVCTLVLAVWRQRVSRWFGWEVEMLWRCSACALNAKQNTADRSYGTTENHKATINTPEYRFA
jgi:hypothetical protein